MIESEHRVHAAVVDTEGRTIASVGDAERITFFRSSAKPFQAMPLVEDGVVAASKLTEAELAVCCASHNAEPGHLVLVRSILEKAGVGEEALECGPHAPFDESAAGALRDAGRSPSRIHNNCSGKHAGMLLLARFHGWEREGYITPQHPVQRRMLEEVARWCELEEQAVQTGVDGCGVVCFAVSVASMARGYANLARAAANGDPAVRIVAAMTSHPFEVAGSSRLCTDLMACAQGDILSKLGADGVYGAAWLPKGWGIGLKIEDGNRRALEVALVEVLRQLGALSEKSVESLARFGRPVTLNTRRESVGGVVPHFDLMWT